MKKILMILCVFSLLALLSFTVSFADIADPYCNPDALIYDENGNPKIDENGDDIMFGTKNEDGSVIYVRKDFSAAVIGLSEIGYAGESFLYRLVKTLYLGDSLEVIGQGTFNEYAALQKIRIGNGLKYVGKDAFFAIPDVELIISGRPTEEKIVVEKGNDSLLTEAFFDVYKNVYIVQDDASELFCRYDGPYTGFYILGGNMLYFNGGVLNTDSECYIDGQKCYFNADNSLTDGIIDISGVMTLLIGGAPAGTGYVEFDGKTYYVSKVTSLLNTKSVLKIAGVYRYFNPDYSLKEGPYEEDGTTRYYIKGERRYGWYCLDGDGIKESYFLSANGNRVTESRVIGGKMYDCNNGVLTLRQGLHEENGKSYYYKDGYKTGGFVEIDGKTYYFLRETYEMVTDSIKKIGGLTRTFNEDHSVNPVSGIQTVSDKTYYYINGEKFTGFRTIDGYTYYFQKSDAHYGEMATGWLSISGRVYYFYRSADKLGRMAVGTVTIGGKRYTFNSNGTINTGFISDANGNVRYYYHSNELHGWYKITENIYYFDSENGYMAIGKKTIGGTEYTFTVSGALVSPYYDGANEITSSDSYGDTFVSSGGWGKISF